MISHTTIRVSERNYLRLKQQGLVGDSFDFVIGKILDQIFKLDSQGFPAKSSPESLNSVSPKEVWNSNG